MKEIITVGYEKGEMDFGINASIRDLTYEQMNELRIMTMVAIGQAERMWRDNQIQPTTGSDNSNPHAKNNK